AWRIWTSAVARRPRTRLTAARVPAALACQVRSRVVAASVRAATSALSYWRSAVCMKARRKGRNGLLGERCPIRASVRDAAAYLPWPICAWIALTYNAHWLGARSEEHTSEL